MRHSRQLGIVFAVFAGFLFLCLPQDASAEKLLGCYKDDWRNRDMTVRGHSRSKPYLLPKDCFAFCKDKKYKYAALQYKGQCFCGNSYGKHGKRDMKECQRPCELDKKQFCGSGLRSLVYDISAPAAKPTPTPQPAARTAPAPRRPVPRIAIANWKTVPPALVRGYKGCYSLSLQQLSQYVQKAPGKQDKGSATKGDDCAKTCRASNVAFVVSIRGRNTCSCANSFAHLGSLKKASDSSCPNRLGRSVGTTYYVPFYMLNTPEATTPACSQLIIVKQFKSSFATRLHSKGSWDCSGKYEAPRDLFPGQARNKMTCNVTNTNLAKYAGTLDKNKYNYTCSGLQQSGKDSWNYFYYTLTRKAK